MSTPANPYAFPASGHPGKQFLEQEGMTLRDYFAGIALGGELASQQGDNQWVALDSLARRSYAIADAMLIWREA